MTTWIIFAFHMCISHARLCDNNNIKKNTQENLGVIGFWLFSTTYYGPICANITSS